MYCKHCKLLPAHGSMDPADLGNAHEQGQAGWQRAPEPTCDHKKHQLPLCDCRKAHWHAGARRRLRSRPSTSQAASVTDRRHDEGVRFVCTERTVYIVSQLSGRLRERRRSRWTAPTKTSTLATAPAGGDHSEPQHPHSGGGEGCMGASILAAGALAVAALFAVAANRQRRQRARRAAVTVLWAALFAVAAQRRRQNSAIASIPSGGASARVAAAQGRPRLPKLWQRRWARGVSSAPTGNAGRPQLQRPCLL
jgi:hypothetical protein